MRGSSTEGDRIVTTNSRRSTSGTMARFRVGVVIAEPAVEQSWQGWEPPPGPELRSAQKWNCAARKINPSSTAQIRVLLGFTNIFKSDEA